MAADPNLKVTFLRGLPIGRMGIPDDIKVLASFLASAPKSPIRSGSSVSKHIASSWVEVTSRVMGRSASSTSGSPVVPVMRNTAAPTGNPASARRFTSDR